VPKAPAPWTKTRVLLAAFDWLAVWAISFISVAFSTYLVDPSTVENLDRSVLLQRAAVIATFITAFYSAVTWLRRPDTVVPKDILEKLPSDPPDGSNPQ
jgi:hypothetical protein